jgi:hypothetical protein
MKNAVTASRLLTGLAVLLVLAGCTVTKPLPAGFYKPAANGSAVLPVKVAVITEGFPATTFRGDNAVVMGQVKLDSYPHEAAVMLREIYRTVTVVPTAAEAADSDMLVVLGKDYPRTLLMTFHDTRSGSVLGAPYVPGLANVNSGKPPTGAAVGLNVFALITGGIGHLTFMAMANKLATQYVADIQADSNTSLQVLRDFIRKQDELMLTPADRAALQDIDTQAAAALAGGDAVGALLGYQQGLAKVLPGGPRALGLQARAVTAAVRMGELPPVPAEAQNLMERGKAALALARSPAEYAPASTYMERALALAPWWSAGHYNAALTQEGGGKWGTAAAHLQMVLQLEPQTPERDRLRQKIAELEMRQERGDKPVGAR